MGMDEALEHRVHPSIPQGERLTTTLKFEVAVRGEVSNRERKVTLRLSMILPVLG